MLKKLTKHTRHMVTTSFNLDITIKKVGVQKPKRENNSDPTKESGLPEGPAILLSYFIYNILPTWL